MGINGMECRVIHLLFISIYTILLRTSMTYDIYSDYVGFICAAKKLGGFKSHPRYTYMLEHVSKQQGQSYLECIFAGTVITKDEVVAFCAINDANGSPQKRTLRRTSRQCIRQPVKFALYLSRAPDSGAYEESGRRRGG